MNNYFLFYLIKSQTDFFFVLKMTENGSDKVDIIEDNNSIRFMEPVMDAEININSIGNIKIWEIVSVALVVFVIISKLS